MLGDYENPCLPGGLACAILLCCAILALHGNHQAAFCLLPVLALDLLQSAKQAR